MSAGETVRFHRNSKIARPIYEYVINIRNFLGRIGRKCACIFSYFLPWKRGKSWIYLSAHWSNICEAHMCRHSSKNIIIQALGPFRCHSGGQVYLESVIDHKCVRSSCKCWAIYKIVQSFWNVQGAWAPSLHHKAPKVTRILPHYCTSQSARRYQMSHYLFRSLPGLSPTFTSIPDPGSDSYLTKIRLPEMLTATVLLQTVPMCLH